MLKKAEYPFDGHRRVNRWQASRFSQRQYSVVVRLLSGEPRTKNATRAYGATHAQRDRRGRIPGVAPDGAPRELHGPVEPPAARHRQATVHGPQRHRVVLSERRH